MYVKDSTGREVEISVAGRYRDDIEVTHAEYVDTGEDVSDEELEYIMDHYGDEIGLQWEEDRIGDSDFACDAAREAEWS